jgi:hypothetical protein
LPLPEELVDAIKAVVNNGVVTYAEVEEFAAAAAQALRQEYAGHGQRRRTRSGKVWSGASGSLWRL